jgi:uncharacterized protein YkwD
MTYKHKYHYLGAIIAAIIILSMVVFPFLAAIFNNNAQTQEFVYINSNSSSVISSSSSSIVSSSSSVFSSSPIFSIAVVSSMIVEENKDGVKPEVKQYEEVKPAFTQPIVPQVIQTQSEIQPEIQPQPIPFVEAPKLIIQTPIIPPVAAIAPPPVLTQPKVNQYTSSNCNIALANQMLALINEHRATNGVGVLSLAGDLNGTACAHSKWMSESGTFSHTGRAGTNPFERCTNAGTACYAENIAYNTETTALNLFTQLKESPGHNANMLDGGFGEIGIGFDGVYVTQNFR